MSVLFYFIIKYDVVSFGIFIIRIISFGVAI